MYKRQAVIDVSSVFNEELGRVSVVPENDFGKDPLFWPGTGTEEKPDHRKEVLGGGYEQRGTFLQVCQEQGRVGSVIQEELCQVQVLG